MKLLYKYREFSENTDKIILNAELYFASHNSFNDPFDCNLDTREISSYSDEEFENYSQKEGKQGVDKEKYLTCLRKKLIKAKSEVGILCMSQDYKNILMWSHYAKNHEGLCFGFDFRLFEDEKIKSSQVRYSENYEYELISFFNPPKGEIKRMFTIKSEFWSYEKEVRFFDFNNVISTKKFIKECLKEIIFGCKADEINIKKIIQLCQLNEFEHVVFKKARIISGKFELDFDDIDKTKYL
ncbi:DUF2971 domain-containing protein [Aliarcobacter butzleri]|uniref:DUF2971 domain-containing protein n=1 Tax=Aliarcobacter butzleri TaxID=28197 RepID=UPI00344B1881